MSIFRNLKPDASWVILSGYFIVVLVIVVGLRSWWINYSENVDYDGLMIVTLKSLEDLTMDSNLILNGISFKEEVEIYPNVKTNSECTITYISVKREKTLTQKNGNSEEKISIKELLYSILQPKYESEIMLNRLLLSGTVLVKNSDSIPSSVYVKLGPDMKLNEKDIERVKSKCEHFASEFELEKQKQLKDKEISKLVTIFTELPDVNKEKSSEFVNISADLDLNFIGNSNETLKLDLTNSQEISEFFKNITGIKESLETQSSAVAEIKSELETQSSAVAEIKSVLETQAVIEKDLKTNIENLVRVLKVNIPYITLKFKDIQKNTAKIDSNTSILPNLEDKIIELLESDTPHPNPCCNHEIPLNWKELNRLIREVNFHMILINNLIGKNGEEFADELTSLVRKLDNFFGTGVDSLLQLEEEKGSLKMKHHN